MTGDELREIEERADTVSAHADRGHFVPEVAGLIGEDIPALVEEVRRLRGLGIELLRRCDSAEDTVMSDRSRSVEEFGRCADAWAKMRDDYCERLGLEGGLWDG